MKIWEKNFRRLLTFVAPKDATPPSFAEKTFANRHKTAKFAKVFSLESFPLYSTMCCSLTSRGEGSQGEPDEASISSKKCTLTLGQELRADFDCYVDYQSVRCVA